MKHPIIVKIEQKAILEIEEHKLKLERGKIIRKITKLNKEIGYIALAESGNRENASEYKKRFIDSERVGIWKTKKQLEKI